MTANDIISKVDQLKPNEYSTAQKLMWLTQADRQLLVDVILKRGNKIAAAQPQSPTEGDLWLDDTILKRYTSEWKEVFPYTTSEAVLLFDEYAEEFYQWYLMTQIDLYNAEYMRYNNSSEMLNRAYQDLERRYNRAVPLPVYRFNI